MSPIAHFSPRPHSGQGETRAAAVRAEDSAREPTAP